MAITAVRFDGSEHFNLFSGTMTTSVVNTTPSGEFPLSTTFPVAAALVKFGPLDMPVHVFDDVGTPPGTSGQSDSMGPHASYPDRSWAKNAKVLVKTDQSVTAVALDATPWETDSTTGRPTLRLNITASATGGAITVWVEVPHTTGR